VDVKQSFDLAKEIPKDFLKISESGIDSAKTIHELKQAGFNGFLIGETFMKEKKPAEACAKFIKEIREYK
jgi:indole-3-glycerol phosphate synthase